MRKHSLWTTLARPRDTIDALCETLILDFRLPYSCHNRISFSLPMYVDGQDSNRTTKRDDQLTL